MMKRRGIFSVTNADSACTTEKRAKRNELTDRLYFNKVASIPEHYNEDTFSFAEILAKIKPEISACFVFMVDMKWLLQFIRLFVLLCFIYRQYPPNNRRTPITLIVGERLGTDFTMLNNIVKKFALENISIGQARLPVPYGTHHSKIYIFESSSGRVHIIVSSANLLAQDWDMKTQCFYHCSGKQISGNEVVTQSDFQINLLKYLSEYKTSQHWDLIEYWYYRIANIDLSHVSPRVVYSVPGVHKGDKLTEYGHPRLRNLINEMFENVDRKDFTYHAQFSSIGNLGSDPSNWLQGQFLKSLAGGTETDIRKLKIIYPCVEDIRNSNEGYAAGRSFPYSYTTLQKQPYLYQFVHKWRSDCLGRTHAMPHVKTYSGYQPGAQTPSWLLVGSANLSKAAWGEYQLKGTQLAIRSYEFNLLFTDPESLKMVPYDFPLTKYGDDDMMWVIDKVYEKLDVFQNTWPASMPERCLLNFGDTAIYDTDLKTLENGRWLSDSVISFAFEYMHKRMLTVEKQDKVHFINAAISQIIKFSSEEVRVQLFRDIQLKNKEHVIVVVSDHDDPSICGGSHWSLLICRRIVRPHFLIIDSAQYENSGNQKAADQIIETLGKFFKIPIEDTRTEPAAQQYNTMDCGMFVIEFTRIYIQALNENDPDVDFTNLSPEAVGNQRKVWSSLIRRMVKEG
ncbi:unnamed protein product [Thelazia callipaeda]|uniref:Tyrosyl-DNA phosphodiesterase 1 n=1 Tax=Thelazia callipaeda TaxID=103827 RepID=A0A0N5CJ92_THECL|nr:unnamed protein product [Thelazia callipaeda]